MIEGVAIEVGRDAVVVTADAPLTVVSSAVVGGGFSRARALVNLHVDRDFDHQDLDELLARFVRERGLPPPYVGLFTGAWTEKAQVTSEFMNRTGAVAAVTVGLTDLAAAGIHGPATSRPGTINTIVVIDGAPEVAALVNAVATVAEVKAGVIAAAGLRCRDGAQATGTPTDAIAVATTGRGLRHRFGGPVSELGALVARVARRALDRGIRQWLEGHA